MHERRISGRAPRSGESIRRKRRSGGARFTDRSYLRSVVRAYVARVWSAVGPAALLTVSIRRRRRGGGTRRPDAASTVAAVVTKRSRERLHRRRPRHLDTTHPGLLILLSMTDDRRGKHRSATAQRRRHADFSAAAAISTLCLVSYTPTD